MKMTKIKNNDENPVSAEILNWGNEKSDFCLISLITPSLNTPISFTFNMEYFIDYVADEHQQLFLEEVFTKMFLKEKIEDFNLNTIDYSSCISKIKQLWKQNNTK